MAVKQVLVTGAMAAGAAPLPVSAQADAVAVQANNAKRLAEVVDVVFNRGDLAAADQYFLPTFIEHAGWPGHTADVAGFKAGLAAMRTSFPDLRMNIERTVAEGDLLVVHMTMSGSQLGEFMGAPASGKTFTIEVIDIVRMSDGRVAEHWGVMDAAAMAGQLGL